MKLETWRDELWPIFSLSLVHCRQKRSLLLFKESRKYDSMSGWAEMWCLWAMPGFSLSPRGPDFTIAHFVCISLWPWVFHSIYNQIWTKWWKAYRRVALCVCLFFARLFGVHPRIKLKSLKMPPPTFRKNHYLFYWYLQSKSIWLLVYPIILLVSSLFSWWSVACFVFWLHLVALTLVIIFLIFFFWVYFIPFPPLLFFFFFLSWKPGFG